MTARITWAEFEQALNEHVEATLVNTFGAERLQEIRADHARHVREMNAMTTEERVRWILGEGE